MRYPATQAGQGRATQDRPPLPQKGKDDSEQLRKAAEDDLRKQKRTSNP